jgi:hypothetical protein
MMFQPAIINEITMIICRTFHTGRELHPVGIRKKIDKRGRNIEDRTVAIRTLPPMRFTYIPILFISYFPPTVH